MADVYEYVIRIDRDEDLAPQVAAYRDRGIPWKILVTLTGRKRNRLQEMVDRWTRANLPSCR